MTRVLRMILGAAACVFLLVVSLDSLTAEGNGGSGQSAIEKKIKQEVPESLLQVATETVPKTTENINDLPLRDNLALYAGEDPSSVVTMYLTVRTGNANEKTAYTWADVNSITKFNFAEVRTTVIPRVEAILQVGDEQGPQAGELGYADTQPNAVVQIRGSRSSGVPQ